MLRAGLRTHLFFKRCPGTSWKLKVPALPCLSKSVFVELNCRCGGRRCLLALSPFCMSWLDCCSLAQTTGEYSREAEQFLMGTKATSLVLKPLDDIFHVWSFHFILLLIAKERQYNPSSCCSFQICCCCCCNSRSLLLRNRKEPSKFFLWICWKKCFTSILLEGSSQATFCDTSF